jgi:hypothetical protein
MRIQLRFVKIWIFLLAVTIPAYAQVSGRVTGTVLDPFGGTIPSALVSLVMPGGGAPLLTTVTTTNGIFYFSGVQPGYYDLVVEVTDFRRHTVPNIKVDPAQETAIPPITLSLKSATFKVEVVGSIQPVQTANAEIATIITNEQVRRLPVIDRHPLTLLTTQAGVRVGGGSVNQQDVPVVINGQRPSFVDVTLDGINISDNYIRSSFLWTPNLIMLDQIEESTLVTSNADTSMGGGSSHVVFATPSGGNSYHGTAYFYNSNSATSANNWFNNKDGVKKPDSNQNQFGVAIGGPIIRDKLYFYANYEAYRWDTEVARNRTILTEDARNGIFTYEDTDGSVQKVDILQAMGVNPDPAMEQLLAAVPGPENINNFRLGDSRESLLKNTAGYSYLLQGYHDRDNITARIDYNHSPANVFSGTLLWNRQDVTRSDLSNDFSLYPKVLNHDSGKLLSLGWRWNPNPQFTNELRGGFNFAPQAYKTNENFGEFIISNTMYSNPVNTFRSEGRDTDTYNLMDNAVYVRGKHILKFGFQTEQVRVESYNEGGIIPTYSLGIGLGNPSLSQESLPGIQAGDLGSANALLATLAGYIGEYSQTFNITSRTSGFVDGAPEIRNYSLNNYAFYMQDTWKVFPSLSLNLGLRYELPSVVDERDSLALLPVIQNNDPVATLLSNSDIDFAGSSAGRPWYKRDKNNFAPNIGLAWDVTGKGKTVLRAGYSVSFINDQTIRAISGIVNFNEGLQSSVNRTGLSGRVSEGLPQITPPTYKVPRTFQDNYQNNWATAFGLPDPNLRTPYIQQWSFGIQHKIRDIIIEARYVGNHALNLYRSFDTNTVLIRENGFLDDFKRALQNGNLFRDVYGYFDPRYNANIPGSQPLTILPLIGGSYYQGFLWHPAVINLIETGQAGELAFTYHNTPVYKPITFYRNPYSLASILLENHSHSSYNALQIDVRRRVRSGFQFQANYTLGKVLSDAIGMDFNRFEQFRDPRNPGIDRARPFFDITHAIKGNFVYDVPSLKSYGLDHGLLNALLSGWTISGITTLQSGNPFSILSSRGTLLRSYRSSANTAISLLNKDQIDNILQFRMTGDGPYIVSSSAIGSDGRGVAPDGQPSFEGQAFYNPAPGEIGALQQRQFSGTWYYGLDLALLRKINLSDRSSLEFRVESSNILNHPTWFVNDQYINSAQFGQITQISNSPRRFQFSLHYRF